MWKGIREMTVILLCIYRTWVKIEVNRIKKKIIILLLILSCRRKCERNDCASDVYRIFRMARYKITARCTAHFIREIVIIRAPGLFPREIYNNTYLYSRIAKIGRNAIDQLFANNFLSHFSTVPSFATNSHLSS